MMRPIEREARVKVSVFREESGWKWRFLVSRWNRVVQAPRTYKHKQSAMRAGCREYRRFFGSSVAEMLEKNEM